MISPFRAETPGFRCLALNHVASAPFIGIQTKPGFRRRAAFLAIAIVCFGQAFLEFSVHAASASPVNEPLLEQEEAEVRELISRSDSVELNKLAPRLFRLANRLLKEKGDAAAKPFFEKGVQVDSWALQEQLTLGEILSREGKPEKLRQKAEMVMRTGEDIEVLTRASHLLDQSPPAPLPQIAEMQRTAGRPVLVLVPVGDTSRFVLEDLRELLSNRLGIDVQLATCGVSLPRHSRDSRMQWIRKTRGRLLEAIAASSMLRADLAKLGMSPEQLQSNDDLVLAVARKAAKATAGAKGLAELNEHLEDLSKNKQWDSDYVLNALSAALSGEVGPDFTVLGVTPVDLCSDSSNFVFGSASTGGYIGVISDIRFRAAFNDEAPNRQRLAERLLKQSLSSYGFMLGVKRCDTPECARAYPKNLAEHDQKPPSLCTDCRAGIGKAIGRSLPSNDGGQ